MAKATAKARAVDDPTNSDPGAEADGDMDDYTPPMLGHTGVEVNITQPKLSGSYDNGPELPGSWDDGVSAPEGTKLHSKNVTGPIVMPLPGPRPDQSAGAGPFGYEIDDIANNHFGGGVKETARYRMIDEDVEYSEADRMPLNTWTSANNANDPEPES